MPGNRLIFQSAEAARDAITRDANIKIQKLYESWADELQERAEYYEKKTASSYGLKKLNTLQLRAQMQETSRRISKEIEGVAKNSIYLVANSVVEANNDWLKKLGFPAEGAFASIPDQTVRKLVTGQIYQGGWNLSSAIWGDSQDTLAKLYEITAKGLAQNMSVYDISKMLEQYVSPNRKLPWNLTMPDGKKIYRKQVDYNAQRLVRTLTQHGYQTSFIAVTEKNPFITKVIWRANGSRVCPLCMDRDGKEFNKNEVPMDHPNGMCTMEPKVVDNLEDKLADWINSSDGTFPEIDEFAKEFGYVPEIKKEVGNATANGIKPIMDKDWIKKNCTSAKMAKGWSNVEDFDNIRDRVTDILSQDFVSDEYRYAFSKASKSIKDYTSNDEGSFFMQGVSSKSKHGTRINIDPAAIIKRSDCSNTAGTIYHEMGHAIDALAPGRDKVFSSMPKYGFQDAMVEDLLNLEKKLQNREFRINFRHSFWDDDSCGVQDAISATPNMGVTKHKMLSGKKNANNLNNITKMKDRYGIATNWGHSDDYWQRNDAVAEAASELFANISSAQVSQEEMKYMKEAFPKSVEVFEKIIKEIK